MKKSVLALALVLMIILGCVSFAAADDKAVVNVFNWED